MTNTTAELISSNVTSELYNISITCTIHPDSTADQCVVMAMADGRMTRTGMTCVSMFVHVVLKMAIISTYL